MSSVVKPQTIGISPMDERAGIQEQILALKSQIRELTQSLNELTPIGRLSPEILVEIFSHLRSDRSWARGGQVPYMLKIAHVSHLWRAVALDCSSLWNQIFFSDEAMVREWLKRSRSSGLSVSLDARHSRDVARLMLSQLHRIHQLQINLDWRRIDDLLQFADVAPTVLSVLDIHCTTSTPGLTLDSLLPFLSQSFPALCDLSIRSCGSVNLASQIFTDLTVLRVDTCSISISILDLLDRLGKMPRLEDLELSTVSLLPGTPQQVVKLPHLSGFVYHGTNGHLDLLLLSQLKFDLAAKSIRKMGFFTNISESSENLASSPTLPMMFAIFSRFWKRPPPIFELKLTIQGETLHFQTSNTQIQVNASSPSEVYERYITWMSQHPSLFQDLEAIHTSGTTNERFWAAVSELSTLRSIHTHGVRNGVLLNTLVENWKRRKATPAGEKKPHLIFPNLERIVLENVDFVWVERDLISALKHRAQTKKLKLLVLTECSDIWDGLVTQLQEVVEVVDWDETGMSDQESEDSDGPTNLCESCGEVLYCDDCN